MDQLDVESFRAENASSRRPAKRPPRHKPGDWFIKGPIPGTWLSTAARLPGRALHVGLALWFLAGLGKVTSVILTWAVQDRFGVSPYSGRRALAALERVGLVSVQRHPGRCPRVTILEVSANEDSRAAKTKRRGSA